MSKTIEFIEKEIEFSKEQIVKYENHLLAFPQVNVENRLEEMKKDLQILEQIKIELEAWETTKENTMGDDFHYEINIYKSDKGYNKFKKGLEVEDE